jgi:hypothetical protein
MTRGRLFPWRPARSMAALLMGESLPDVALSFNKSAAGNHPALTHSLARKLLWKSLPDRLGFTSPHGASHRR